MRIKLERETTLTFNEQEPDAFVWSASKPFIRKMAKRGYLPTKSEEDGKGHLSYWYKIPKTAIVISKPRMKVTLSEERRVRLRENLEKARSIQKAT